jgi:YD repeat-containing protein
MPDEIDKKKPEEPVEPREEMELSATRAGVTEVYKSDSSKRAEEEARGAHCRGQVDSALKSGFNRDAYLAMTDPISLAIVGELVRHENEVDKSLPQKLHAALKDLYGLDATAVARQSNGSIKVALADKGSLEFSKEGKLLEKVDAEGNKTEYKYDGNKLIGTVETQYKNRGDHFVMQITARDIYGTEKYKVGLDAHGNATYLGNSSASEQSKGKSEVSIDSNGNLLRTFSADGTRVITKPDGTTLTETSTANHGREVTARDAEGKESYAVRFDADGKASYFRDREGNEYTSPDGKHWKATNGDHSRNWSGSIKVNSAGDLVRTNDGEIYTETQKPDGTKICKTSDSEITKYPNGTSTIEKLLPDKSKQLIALDADGKETFRVGFAPDGTLKSVTERGGLTWTRKQENGHWTDLWESGRAGDKEWQGRILLDGRGNLLQQQAGPGGKSYSTEPSGVKAVLYADNTIGIRNTEGMLRFNPQAGDRTDGATTSGDSSTVTYSFTHSPEDAQALKNQGLDFFHSVKEQAWNLLQSLTSAAQEKLPEPEQSPGGVPAQANGPAPASAKQPDAPESEDPPTLLQKKGAHQQEKQEGLQILTRGPGGVQESQAVPDDTLYKEAGGETLVFAANQSEQQQLKDVPAGKSAKFTQLQDQTKIEKPDGRWTIVDLQNGIPYRVTESNGNQWVRKDNNWIQAFGPGRAAGELKLHKDGSYSFIGSASETRIHNDGAQTIVDHKTKDRTNIAKDSSSVTTNGAGVVAETVDSSGHLAIYKHDQDKKLAEYTDKTGHWQKQSDGIWKNLTTGTTFRGDNWVENDGSLHEKSYDGKHVCHNLNGSHFSFDARNRITESINARGQRFGFEYSDDSQAPSVFQNGSGKWVRQKDGSWLNQSNGAKWKGTVEIDPKAGSVTETWANGVMSRTNSADGTELWKDRENKTSQFTDGRGDTYQFFYSGNLLNKVYYPDGSVAERRGDHWEKTIPGKNQPEPLQSITLDTNEKLTERKASGSLERTLDGTWTTLDSHGRVTQVEFSDKTNSQLKWSAPEQGNKLEGKITKATDGALAYYDEHNEISKVLMRNGQWREFKRDDLGRVKEILESGKVIWTSDDGKTFVNKLTGDSITGTLMIAPDGTYKFMRQGGGELQVNTDGSVTRSGDKGSVTTHSDKSQVLLNNKGAVIKTSDTAGRILTAEPADRSPDEQPAKITLPNGLILKKTDENHWQQYQLENGKEVLKQNFHGTVEFTPKGDLRIKFANQGLSTATYRLDGSILSTDERGRLRLITDKKGGLTQLDYDGRGNLQGMKLPDGSRWTKISQYVWLKEGTTETWQGTRTVDNDGAVHMKEMKHVHVGSQPKWVETGNEITRRTDGWEEHKHENGSKTFERLNKDGSYVIKNDKDQIIEIKKANGNVFKFGYDANGAINRITMPHGATWATHAGTTWYSTDPRQPPWQGKIVAEEDGTHREISQGDKRVRIFESGGAVIDWEQGAFGKDSQGNLNSRVTMMQTAKGDIHRLHYDAQGKLNAVEFPHQGGASWQKLADNSWQQVYSDGKKGATIGMEFSVTTDGQLKQTFADESNRRQWLLAAEGKDVSQERHKDESAGGNRIYSHDGSIFDEKTKLTATRQKDTSIVFTDERGRVVKVKTAAGVTEYGYNEHGTLNRITKNGRDVPIVGQVRVLRDGTEKWTKPGGEIVEFRHTDGTKTIHESGGVKVLNDKGLIVKTIDSQGKQKEYQYGNVTRLVGTKEITIPNQLTGYTDENGNWLTSENGFDWKGAGGYTKQGVVILYADGALRTISAEGYQRTTRLDGSKREGDDRDRADLRATAQALGQLPRTQARFSDTGFDQLLQALADRPSAEVQLICRMLQKQTGLRLGDSINTFSDTTKAATLTALLGKTDSVNFRTLSDDPAGKIHVALTELTGLRWTGRTNQQIEKDIRLTLLKLNAQEIEELKKEYSRRFGTDEGLNKLEKDITDAVSPYTKDAVHRFLKGNDRVSTTDQVKLMQNAYDAGDLNLFEESCSTASPQARKAFIAKLGGGGEDRETVAQRKLFEKWGNKNSDVLFWQSTNRDACHALEALFLGELSVAQTIRDSTGYLWDNERTIEKVLNNLTPEQHRLYRKGEYLAKNQQQFRINDPEHVSALAFYSNLEIAIGHCSSNPDTRERIRDQARLQGGGLISDILKSQTGKATDLYAATDAIQNMTRSQWDALINDSSYQEQLNQVIKDTRMRGSANLTTLIALKLECKKEIDKLTDAVLEGERSPAKIAALKKLDHFAKMSDQDIDRYLAGRAVQRRLQKESASTDWTSAETTLAEKARSGDATAQKQLMDLEFYRNETFKAVQLSAREPVLSAIANASPKRVITALLNMNERERLQYKENRNNFRTIVDQEVQKLLKNDGPATAMAKKLLKQISEASDRPPQLDLIDKLNMMRYDTHKSPGEKLRAIERLLREEPDLKRRVATDQELAARFEKAARDLLPKKFGTDGFYSYYDPFETVIKPLLAGERLTGKQLSEFYRAQHASDGNQQTELGKHILTISTDELVGMRDRSELLKWMNPTDRKVVENIFRQANNLALEKADFLYRLDPNQQPAISKILNQEGPRSSEDLVTISKLDQFQQQRLAELLVDLRKGPVSAADKVRLFVNGTGIIAAKDVKEMLGNMTLEQKSVMFSEYAAKYGVELRSSLLGKTDAADKSQMEYLLRSHPMSPGLQFEKALDQATASDGWSSWAMKDTHWEGPLTDTRQRLMDIVKEIKEAKQQGRPINQETINRLESSFRDALLNFRGSKKEFAEAVYNTALAVAALGAAPLTGGTSLAPLLYGAFVGATLKVGTRMLIEGADYDSTVSNMLRELASGGLEGFAFMLAPGNVAAATNLGKQAATKAAALAVESTEASMLLVAGVSKDAAKRAVAESLQGGISKALGDGAASLGEKELKSIVSNLVQKGIVQAGHEAAALRLLESSLQTAIKLETQALAGLKYELFHHAANFAIGYGSGALGTSSEQAFAGENPFSAENLEQSASSGLGAGLGRALMGLGSRALHGLIGRHLHKSAETVQKEVVRLEEQAKVLENAGQHAQAQAARLAVQAAKNKLAQWTLGNEIFSLVQTGSSAVAGETATGAAVHGEVQWKASFTAAGNLMLGHGAGRAHEGARHIAARPKAQHADTQAKSSHTQQPPAKADPAKPHSPSAPADQAKVHHSPTQPAGTAQHNDAISQPVLVHPQTSAPENLNQSKKSPAASKEGKPSPEMVAIYGTEKLARQVQDEEKLPAAIKTLEERINAQQKSLESAKQSKDASAENLKELENGLRLLERHRNALVAAENAAHLHTEITSKETELNQLKQASADQAAINKAEQELANARLRFNQAKLDYASATGTVPPGIYKFSGQVGPDGAGLVTIIVNPGRSVSLNTVEAVIAEAARIGLKPETIRFIGDHSSSYDGRYQGDTLSRSNLIEIKDSSSGEPRTCVFEHESGHLFETPSKAISRNPAVLKIYKEIFGVNDPTGEKANLLKQALQLTQQEFDALKSLVLDDSHPNVNPNANWTAYAVSRPELVAEFFKFSMERAKAAERGVRLSFDELLQFASEGRANLLRPFQALFEHMDSQIFQPSIVSNQAQTLAGRSYGKDILDPALQQMRAAADRAIQKILTDENIILPPGTEPNLKQIVAHKHNLDVDTTDFTKLTGDAKRDYLKYQSLISAEVSSAYTAQVTKPPEPIAELAIQALVMQKALERNGINPNTASWEQVKAILELYGIDVNSFAPSKLVGEARADYERYQQFKNRNFDPSQSHLEKDYAAYNLLKDQLVFTYQRQLFEQRDSEIRRASGVDNRLRISQKDIDAFIAKYPNFNPGELHQLSSELDVYTSRLNSMKDQYDTNDSNQPWRQKRAWQEVQARARETAMKLLQKLPAELHGASSIVQEILGNDDLGIKSGELPEELQKFASKPKSQPAPSLSSESPDAPGGRRLTYADESYVQFAADGKPSLVQVGDSTVHIKQQGNKLTYEFKFNGEPDGEMWTTDPNRLKWNVRLANGYEYEWHGRVVIGEKETPIRFEGDKGKPELRENPFALRSLSLDQLTPAELQQVQDAVKDGKSIKNMAIDALKANRILAIGEVHSAENPHRVEFSKHFAEMKAQGATHLAVEIPRTNKIEAILREFSKPGSKITAREALESIAKEMGGERAKEKLLQPTYIQLLDSARNAGLQIVPVDSTALASLGINSAQQNAAVAKNINDVLQENSSNKVIVWIGADHLRLSTDEPGLKTLTQYLRDEYKHKMVTVCEQSPALGNTQEGWAAMLSPLSPDKPVVVATSDNPVLSMLGLKDYGPRSAPDERKLGDWDYIVVYPDKTTTKPAADAAGHASSVAGVTPAEALYQTALTNQIHELNKGIKEAESRGDQQEKAALTKQIYDILLTEARIAAKRMGIPAEVIAPESIQVVDLGKGKLGLYIENQHVIQINPNGPEPIATLHHELKHLAQAIERTALYAADSKSFEKRLLNSLLAGVGSGDEALYTGLTGKDMVAFPRVKLSNDGAHLMRQAILEYLAKYPDKARDRSEHFKKLLQQPKYAALVSEIGDLSAAWRALSQEVNLYRFVKNTQVISQETLDTNPHLKAIVDHKARLFEKSKDTYGGSLENHPAMIKNTAGRPEASTAYVHPGYYKLSTEEFGPQRFGIATVLQALVHDLRSAFSGDLTAQDQRLALKALIVQKGTELIAGIRVSNMMQRVVSSLAESRAANMELAEVRQSIDSLQKQITALEKTSTAAPSAELEEARAALESNNKRAAELKSIQEAAIERAKKTARELLPIFRPDEPFVHDAINLMIKQNLITIDEVPEQLRKTPIAGKNGEAPVANQGTALAKQSMLPSDGAEGLVLFQNALQESLAKLQHNQELGLSLNAVSTKLKNLRDEYRNGSLTSEQLADKLSKLFPTAGENIARMLNQDKIAVSKGKPAKALSGFLDGRITTFKQLIDLNDGQLDLPPLELARKIEQLKDFKRDFAAREGKELPLPALPMVEKSIEALKQLTNSTHSLEMREAANVLARICAPDFTGDFKDKLRQYIMTPADPRSGSICREELLIRLRDPKFIEALHLSPKDAAEYRNTLDKLEVELRIEIRNRRKAWLAAHAGPGSQDTLDTASLYLTDWDHYQRKNPDRTGAWEWKGGAKARGWRLTLGYSQDNFEGLADQLWKYQQNFDTSKAIRQKPSPFTGSSERLKPDQVLDLTGRSIHSDTFNKLPAEIRKRISGSEQPLPADTFVSEHLLAGKFLTADEFNRLPGDELRQLLTARPRFSLEMEIVGANGRRCTVSSIWDQMPEGHFTLVTIAEPPQLPPSH